LFIKSYDSLDFVEDIDHMIDILVVVDFVHIDHTIDILLVVDFGYVNESVLVP